MRVQVQIPGTVESYCVNERGDKLEASEDHWLETYLCSVLRAYSYADDGSGEVIKKIVGVRRFNPITNTEAEHRFLEAAETLFFNGWQLGSDPDIQVPNLVSNHLSTGLLDYIRTTGRYTSGINLFEKLRMRDAEISSLLARVYIAGDEEVKAVQLLHEAIKELPMDYSLLDAQAEFCMSKGRSDLALELAKRSVVSAPSEFGTWARLAEVYISLEQWDMALLTLNSCPMFTYQDKDSPRLPEPLRVSLPLAPETMCDEIDDAGAVGETELVHPTLRRLSAAAYKGTFRKGYALLTEITKRIGWDQLLKIRSQVFVMEEEYRNERQATVTVVGDHTRNASTTGIRSPSSPGPGPNGGGGADDYHSEPQERPPTAASASTSLPPTPVTPDYLRPEPSKPPHTITVATSSETPDPQPPLPSDPSHSAYTQFQHKRLCERWLDNLFMVLYEDLRVYTIWRTESAQYAAQRLQYKKSSEEWEILGDLADRLHREDESVEAYANCLDTRFSPKAMKAVLKHHEKHADLLPALGCLIRLIAWQAKWYSEVCFIMAVHQLLLISDNIAQFSPALLHTIRRLIEDEGAVKVRSIIQATSLPQHILDLTHGYAGLCAQFRSTGTEG